MTHRVLLLLPLYAWLGAAGCGDLGGVNAALAVRYTPDGTLVVFAGDAIDVYDETLATRMARIPAPQTGGGYGKNFSLSDDGTVAAVSDYDSSANRAKIDLFSIPGGAALAPVDLGPPPPDMAQGYVPEDLALSPRGDLVYVMGGVAQTYRHVAMFDTATGATLWSAAWAISPAFSSDGSQIYVSGDQGSDLLGFDARSGASILDAPVAASPDGMSSTSDPHALVALTDDGTIELLSTYDGSSSGQFEAVSKTEGLYGALALGMPAFRCSPQAGLCAVGVEEITGVMNDPGGAPYPVFGGTSRVKIWSTTGTLYQDLGVTVSADDLAVSPDGQYLAAADSQGDVEVFRVSDGSLVNSRHYGGSPF